MLPQPSLRKSDDWLYLGKGARIIHFEVNTDIPNQENTIVLHHNTGYIVLNQQSFHISAATILGTSLAQYENGELEFTETSVLKGRSDTNKKEKKKLDYLAALKASLDKSIHHGFGELVQELLSKGLHQSVPESLTEQKKYGLTRTCDFGGSWQALERVEWYSRGTNKRTICQLRVVLKS